MSTPATARWSTLVAELAASGQSVRAFCAPRGLNPKTLSWWRWNLGHHEEKSKASVFLELSVMPDLPASVQGPEPLVIELPQVRALLSVTHNTDLSLLRRIVEAMC